MAEIYIPMQACVATFLFSSILAAAMFPAVADAIEIKTPTISMPHVTGPHVTTPQVNTHIVTPQVKLHVTIPEGSTGSKITNTNSDNITIKDLRTKLNQTNGLQRQQSKDGTIGGAMGAASSGTVTFKPFDITGKIDSASPSLSAASAPGAPFSFNKVDFTGKASVVSLIHTGTSGGGNAALPNSNYPGGYSGDDFYGNGIMAPDGGGGPVPYQVSLTSGSSSSPIGGNLQQIENSLQGQLDSENEMSEMGPGALQIQQPVPGGGTMGAGSAANPPPSLKQFDPLNQAAAAAVKAGIRKP
jgi:hypothetical protein